MNFTDHGSAASPEDRKHMAGKQILQFYAVSVKKKVKHYKFKTKNQTEAVGEKLHPEVCGEESAGGVCGHPALPVSRMSRHRNPRSPLLTNTTQNSESL